MHNPLGFQVMPEGYTLERCDDHWFYYHEATDHESPIHWDMWVIFRWARESARKSE